MVFSKLIVYRDGVLINSNVTSSPFIDPSILSPNTGYLYKFIPYDPSGIAGSATVTRFYTLPDLASLSASSTSAQVILEYSGNYTNVNITRDGSSIATGINTTTYTDTGLTINTSYTYIVTPIGITDLSGSALSVTKSTTPSQGTSAPYITSLSVPSETSSQITLVYSGDYTKVSITRNGTQIAANLTGNTYTDTGLTANTSYIYIVTPYNSVGDSGAVSIIAQKTLPSITSVSIAGYTSSQIVLEYSGNYTNVSITRDGTSIVTNITGTTYTDTGLTPNTSYTYVVTSNNSVGAGTSLSIIKITLPNITSLSIPSITATEIVLEYSGNYTNVSITRDGTNIATNITGTTYTDSGLIGNTSYIYILTSHNSSGNSGIIAMITQKTLPNIISLSISSYTATQNVLLYSGNYTNVNIIRNGSSIATNITGTTYTDVGLNPNTSYTYIVTPYNSVGTGTALSTINVTLPNITGLSISSNTNSSQIVLEYAGTYTNVSIKRNGSFIATNIAGTTYTDSSGITSNTFYTYIVIPHNSVGISGITSSTTYNTLGLLSSISVSSETTTQIVLSFSGSYTKVSILRDEITIATNITGTTYTDTGLTVNTSYTYKIIPYNVNGDAGTLLSITQSTLSNITSFGIYSESDTEIVLQYTGNYTFVSITRDGSSVATNITGMTYYTDTGLTANTSYTYVVTSNNSVGVGTSSSITQQTLPIAPTIGVPTVLDISSVSVAFTGSSVGTGTITGYTVTSSPGGLTGTGTTSPITVSGLTSNTHYTFTVTATNTGGTSVASSQSSTVTTPPNSPTINTVSVSSISAVNVYFTAPSGSGIITSYTVTSSLGITSSSAFSPITVSGLTANTVYTFTVTATNAGGTSVASSQSTSVTTKPNSPTIGTSTVINANAVSVAFTAPSGGNGTITSYTVTSSLGDTNIGSSSPIIVYGLAANTEYTFTVTATNSGGTSISSVPSSEVTTTPNAPTIGTTTVSSLASVVNVAFTAPSGGNGAITGYTVTSSSGGLTGTGITSPITVTGLSSNTSYTFTITATNSGGTSVVSGESSVTTKPNSPTIGAATVSGSSSVSVAFTPPSGGTGTITGYTVTSILGDTATGTSSPITVSGLTANTVYTFTVTATNSGGTSGSSSASTAVTTISGAPTIGAATSLSSTAISVVFIQPSVGNGAITSYTVTSNLGDTATGTSSPITVSGLTSNTAYTFTVTAINSGGTSISSSASTSVKTQTSAPTIGVATVLDASSVSVAFTAPGGTGTITGYIVTSSPGGLMGTGTSSPITVSGLTSNTVYTFTVTATNSGGTSVASVPSTLVTTVSGSPTIGTATISSATVVSVTFTAPSGNGTITSYTVTSSPGDFIGIRSSSPITVSGLTTNTIYTFTVTATNSGGTSASSSASTQVTMISGAPTIGTATVLDASSVSVAFTAPTGNGTITGYTVTSIPGGLTGAGTSSPITVLGLTSNTSYTFTVTATNSSGTSVPSFPSTSVTTRTIAPTIGTATVSSYTDIIVYFTPPSGGNGTITGYTVTSSLGDTATGSSSPIMVSGLTSNTAYTFTVTATNSGGTSVASSASTSVTTQTSSPTIGIATVLDSSSVSVAFTAPGGTIISYTVISSPGSLTGTGSSSPITVTGLISNTAYTFTVTAVNSSGISTSSVESTSVTTRTRPPIIGTATVLDSTNISISFTEPSGGTGTITGYTVTSSPSGLTATGSSSPITVAGLTGNTAYTFTVTATNSGGTSSASSASTSVITIPNPPSTVEVTVLDSSSVSIAFTAPDGSGTIIGYTVTSFSGLTVTGTSSPIIISGLNANTTYIFTVTATNSGGTSNASNSSTVTTKPVVTSFSVSSVTATHIVLLYSGNYSNVSITRNGTTILSNNTGTSYTDSGLSPNISYTYIVTPYNSNGIGGSTLSITEVTLPNITLIGVSSITSSSIVLVYAGNYENVSISRGGSTIATHITGTTYTDSSGLTAYTSYTYIVTPYNSAGIAGITSSITYSILGLISSESVYGKSTEIDLVYSGSYTTVNISRNGTQISTNNIDSSYSDTGLIANTSYTYIVTPFDSSGNAGIASTITQSTFNSNTSSSFGIYSDSDTQVTLLFGINSMIMNITRNGTYIAFDPSGLVMDLSGSFIDGGLSPNTSYTYIVTSPTSSSSITQSTLPSAPTVVSATVSSTTIVSVAFTPSSGTITSYRVTSNPGGIIGTGSSSPVTVSGLSANTPYTFTVTATNSNSGETSASSSATTTVTTNSNAPTIGTATVLDASSISVAFTPPSGTGTITSYTVTSSPGGLTGTGTSSPITVTGLTSNTAYTFTVTATNSSGTSVASSSSTSVTTLPSSPTIGTASVLDSSSVSVAFTTPSGGNGTITGYTVTSSSSTTIVIGTGTSSPIIVSGLTANTPYTFTVTATNSGGTSRPSGSSTSVTTKTIAPTIGVSTVLDVSSVSVEFITPGGTGTITGYTVTSSPGGLTGTGTSSPIIVFGLTSNTPYTFTVTATNSGGTSVASSATTTVTTLPGSPTIGTATVLSLSSVSVAFTATGGTGYTVTSSSGLTSTGTSSPITVTGLTQNTIYTFTVTATNSSGTSVASSATTTVTTKPDAPIIGTTTVLDASSISVVFTQQSVGDGTITGYTVTSSPGSLTWTGTSSPIIVSGLTSNTIYTFTVTATNSGGTSVASSASSAVTTKTSSPTIGTATVSSLSAVSVAFTEPSGGTGTITGYTVTSSPGGLTGTGSSSPISVSGLTPNTIYTFTVTATNSGGTSVASSASSAVTTQTSSPTIGIVTVLDVSSVSVAFTAPSGGTGTITSYTVTSSPGGLTGTGSSSPITVVD